MVRIEALSGVIDADPGSGLVEVGAGTVLADLNEELAAARAGDGEPRRHRPPDDRRGDLDRHPRHRRAAAQHLRPGRGAGAGPAPTAACAGSSAATDPELLRAARVGIGALGAISAVTLRCVPAFTLERVDTPRAARGGARLLPGARRRQRPLRALHLPLRRQRPGAGAQPHRGAAAAARPGRRLPQRRRARELGAGGALGDRQGASRGRSRRSRGWPGGSPRAAARSTAATASSPTSAASASPRWSTACRASTGPRRRGG